MKMEITIAEVSELINEIRKQPESLFEMIRANVQETVGAYLSTLMGIELSEFLGRDRYERSLEDINHRNGSYGRKFTLKGIGKVDLKVPRDRKGEFKTEVIPRSKQYEDALREDLSVMFLAGVSTRTLSLISERLIGRKISAGEVSKVSSQLNEAVERWRERDLSKEAIKYLFVDGTFFSMRVEGSIEKVPVLVAIGVSVDGRRTVLGLQAGDKESAPNWRELFKDLRQFKRWHAWVAGVPVYKPGGRCRVGFVLSGNNLGGDFSAKEGLVTEGKMGFQFLKSSKKCYDLKQDGGFL